MGAWSSPRHKRQAVGGGGLWLGCVRPVGEGGVGGVKKMVSGCCYWCCLEYENTLPQQRWWRTAAVTLFLLVFFRKPGNIKCRFKSGHKKKNIHRVTQAGQEKMLGNLFRVLCPYVPLCCFNRIKWLN